MAMGLGSVHASGQGFSIDAHVLAAGTSARSSSPCFRLQATIAEPAPGYSSSTDFSLWAGFRALTADAVRDDIFFSGFEACP